MKNSISALPNYSGLHNSLYNIAKAELKTLLDKSISGNVEIKKEIPICDGDSETQNLKIALHVDKALTTDPTSRIVTLRSLTKPSVAVAFNAISPEGSNFSPDDKLFTALDFIFRLVPQGFESDESIESYNEVHVDDIEINLHDNKTIDPYRYTKNESDELTFLKDDINGLSISKAPESL